jgi:tetratricopeptide (TPR) repeat protein
MSRTMIGLAAVMIAVACGDRAAVTSPESTGALFSAANSMPCTAEKGQQLIDAGQYKQAINQFTCVIGLDPTAAEGYRGRIEAQLMLGLYSDAFRDYTRVTAFVEPVHMDAMQTIVAGYQARLKADPAAIVALTGLSFAHWYTFNYPAAMHVLDDLLQVQANDVFGNLFRGSSRVLQGAKRAAGAADLERAIELAPSSPDVRFIVADAYTYGSLRDAQRAFDEATYALNGGLDTPRVRAILASSYHAFGNQAAAAAQIAIHIDLVTTEVVATSPLAAGSSMTLGLVPGRTYDIPVAAAAGEALSIATSSKDFWDTILVLLAPDGTPVVGSDDHKGYFAGLDNWLPPADGTYRLRVTSFEAVNTGQLVVSRK